MWQMGIYVTSAVQTAVSNSIWGKKSKAEYLKEPLTSLAKKENDEELTENEKKAQRNKLLASLQLMQANFELNHSKGEQE